MISFLLLCLLIVFWGNKCRANIGYYWLCKCVIDICYQWYNKLCVRMSFVYVLLILVISECADWRKRGGRGGRGRVCGRAFVFRWRLLDYRTSVERDPKLIGSLLRWSGGR